MRLTPPAIALSVVLSQAIAPVTAQPPSFTTNDLGQITSIENLAIPGYGTYRVTFHSGSYNEHYDPSIRPATTGTGGRRYPTFFNDPDGAEAAAIAISSSLSDRYSIAESSSVRPSDGFRIPYEEITRRDSEFITYIGEGIGFSPAPGIDNINSGRQSLTVAIGIGADSTFHTVSWAKFTRTPTPEN